MSTASEIAWAAGIFEGEGSVSQSGRGRYDRPYVRASVGMTDHDVLLRLQSVLGGGINGPYTPVVGGKPFWTWVTYGWDGVEALEAVLFDWLGVRRRQQFADALADRPPPYDAGASNREKTHCLRGHTFTVENTLIRPDGSRLCRACRRELQRSRRAQKVAT